MFQILDFHMVKKLYTKQDLERSIRGKDQMEGGSKIEEDTKSPNQKNVLKMRRINVLKTNIV